MQTNLEMNALAVIDVLVQEGDFFTAEYGQVLVSLTRRIYGEDKKVGDPEYKAISMAVLYLEQADLITVAFERLRVTSTPCGRWQTVKTRSTETPSVRRASTCWERTPMTGGSARAGFDAVRVGRIGA